jgi:magnesium-transporting ATPase (P-type)
MDRPAYQLPAAEVLSSLKTKPEGLAASEVAQRQQQHGRNVLPKPKSKTLAEIFLRQFLNPLIYVLIGAAIVSVATGDKKDAIFIAVIIIINSILGAYQEWRAENSAKALQEMVRVKCRVKRDNRVFEVDSEDVVAGDIVILESGIKVPADIRLIEVKDLSIEEALLTGESVAVKKTVDPLKDKGDLPIGDRHNMAFAATAVQKGRGVGVVTAIAGETEIGKIADSLRTTESEKPPLERRMENFSKVISFVVLGICVVLGVIGYMEGTSAREIFFVMVAAGVSAIPEGLPVAFTVALSVATRRMAARHVIVRKLPAVEGLGSCSMIASDKTGTLTLDQQSIRKIVLPDGKALDVTGEGYNGEGEIREGNNRITEVKGPLEQFMLASILSNEAILRKTDKGWEHSGDAVDVAFRALAYKLGKAPKDFQQMAEVVALIPYESERKFSGVYFKRDGKTLFAMKGAVEIILEKLGEEEKEKLTPVAEKMAAEGLRVLALAGAIVDNTDINRLPALQPIGLIGMIDPLRPEARDAVEKCHKAGIRVVMVTGDHPATALSIARELGIANDVKEVIAGPDISGMEKMSPQEFSSAIREKKVFARVAPLQKQRIVEAMKVAGHFIAVTGDGANDAPALKSAHIGVAMGSGTDLAKEASSIIITDNNFASIAAGVEEGRFTFDNLRKIIYMLLSTGAAELLVIALAIVFNLPLPFTAVQLLWLNLVTNGIQDVALAFEKGDPEVMKRPPRKPDENIFDRLMISEITVSGLVIAGIVFAGWQYMTVNLSMEETHARTVTMMMMVLLQNFHTLNCRSETRSLFSIPVKSNYLLFGAIILAQALHISAAYIPGLGETLELEPITFNEWLAVLPVAASIVLAMEIFKLIWRRTRTINS